MTHSGFIKTSDRLPYRSSEMPDEGFNETGDGLLQAIIEPGSNHTCASGATGGWRCPVCGAVSPTAGAAQRHMDAHQGVKAFRCTICRYKGNTLRGMRTHIRMHFEKRGTDLQVGAVLLSSPVRVLDICREKCFPSLPISQT
jgi:hypothetical protein